MLDAPVDQSPGRTAVVACLLVASLCGVATVGSVVLRVIDGMGPGPTSMAAVAFAATGAVLAASRRRSVPGWLLLLAASSLAVSNVAHDWARHTLVDEPGSLPAGGVALWLGSWVWVVAYCVVAALLPLRLPDGERPTGRWRWVWWLAVVTTVLAALSWALTPYDRMDRPPLDGLGAGVVSPAGTAAGPVLLALSLPLVVLSSLAGLVSLVVRLRRSRGEERQQLKWVVYGGSLTVVILLVAQVVGPEGGSDVLLALGVLPLPLGIAVAGLRYHLWDVDFVVRRTISYAMLTGLVVATYAVAVLGLGGVLGERTGAPLLATVVVALVAEPVRVRLQRLVDRLTKGDTADPYRALVQLGSRLDAAAAEPASTEVLASAAAAVRHALRLPWATVEVQSGPDASSGDPTGPSVDVPLVHGGQVVGTLRAGTPRGQPLRPGDLRLLEDLARPVAVAAHAAQLRDALQTSRERVVVAAEEERRRLRRDLHDDLGPVLAAVALQLGEVSSQLEGHPAQALAARAQGLLTGAVGTVRRIVDGLRPAALDDLGLAEAIVAAAAAFESGGTRVDVRIEGELSDLPAAVEVASLRITAEALANVARHAGASRVRVGVERRSDLLEITVADDGRGVVDGALRGVGLQSMEERAEELGGRCWVVSRLEGGTVVTAELPIPDARMLTGIEAIR
jgi:signal transduction histidine kinase